MKNLLLFLSGLLFLSSCNKKTSAPDNMAASNVKHMNVGNSGRVNDAAFAEVNQLISTNKVEDAQQKLLAMKSAYEASSDWDAYLRSVMQLCQVKMVSGSEQSERDYDSRLPNVIDFLRQELKGKEDPVKSILTNLLAGSYASLMYYKANAGRDITSVNDKSDQDYLTWSNEQLQVETNRLMLASIENEALSNYPLRTLDLIIGKRKGIQIINNIYDFLMINVLDYLKNPTNFITEPVYKFEIRGPEYFAPIEEFTHLKIESRDSLSMIHKSLLVYQKLMSHYEKAGNDTALYWLTNFDRLKFVYEHSVDPQKTEQYLNALNDFIKNGKEGDWKALYKWQTIAIRYVNDTYNPAEPGKGDKLLLKKLHQEATALINNYKDKELPGVIQAQEFIENITGKSFGFSADKVQLPGKPFPILVNYKNTTQVKAEIFRLTRDQFLNLRWSGRDKELVKADYPKVSDITTSVTDPGDFRMHSAELRCDQLPAGYYMVYSDQSDRNYPDYALLQVTGIQATLSEQNGQKREYIITDRFTGHPMQGVKAELMAVSYDRKRTFTPYTSAISDKDGLVSISGKNDQQYLNIFSKGDQELISDNQVYFYKDYNYERQSYNYRIFTDRAIYRPGQTVYFKAIVYKLDNENVPEIVAGKDVKLSLHDVNGQQLQTINLRSNEFGSVTGTFTLPASGLTGQFSINIEGNYALGFSVEEYKRPSFELTFDTISAIYKLGDKVTVKGIAKNYAGVPLSDATVKYTVTRTRYIRWYGFYRSNKFMPQPDNNEMVILNGTTTTDAAGNYAVTFDAIPDESIAQKMNPLFRFQVHADVTDISGETQQIDKTLIINYKGLDVSYDIPQPADISDLTQFRISTKNIESNDIAVKGKLIVEKLKQPAGYLRPKSYATPEFVMLDRQTYKALWPYEPYLDEADVTTWPITQTVINTGTISGPNDLNKLAGSRITPGTYRIIFVPEGQDRPDNKNAFYLNVPTDRERKLLEPGIHDLFAMTVAKSSYTPDNNAMLYALANNPSGKVFMNASRNGKTIWQKWVNASNVATEMMKLSRTYLGGIAISAFATGYNTHDTRSQLINIPWTEKELNIQLVTFRDKLQPGSDESWQLKISGPNKDKVNAEVLASMYDQSLDVFAKSPYEKISFPTATITKNYSPVAAGAFNYSVIEQRSAPAENFEPSYIKFRPELVDRYYLIRYSYYGHGLYIMSAGVRGGRSAVMLESAELDNTSQAASKARAPMPDEAKSAGTPDRDQTEKSIAPPLRTNLEETVFFYPDLKTDSEGNVYVRFKMKEALTRWLFRVYAHTKTLQQGYAERTVTTSKELMVFPHLPRYFRESDELELTAKISSMQNVSGQVIAKLQLVNAVTEQPLEGSLYLDNQQKQVNLPAGSSSVVSWKIKAPSMPVEAVKVRITAETAGHQDGEENTLPVLSNRMLVTETMPMNVRAGQKRGFDFAAMTQTFGSGTMVPYRYTVEYTSNPVWYAIQALPYIMEYPHECTEQILNRYAANAMAADITQKFPKIKAIFDRWRSSDALLSNLQKNQELKSALLEETPWVLEAKNEEIQKKNIAILFDLNRMSAEEQAAMQKITERQYANGGFPWFPGGPDNEYMTSYVLENVGHLRRLDIASAKNAAWTDMAQRAINYCDQQVAEHYRRLLDLYKDQPDELKKDHADHWVYQYLYARSFFESRLPKGESFDYYYGQMKQYWTTKNIYMQGITATVLNRFGDQVLAKEIMEGLRQTATKSDELGMYWTTPYSWFWYQLPVETQSLMIEAFDEITNNQAVVDELKLWLLKNKQTTHWPTTKGTAAAIFALMGTGGAPSLETIEPTISVGNKPLSLSEVKQEAGTGYFRVNYHEKEIRPEMAHIEIKNNSKVVNWGSAYWQYFEQLDKIKVFKDTPLNISRTFNVVRKTDRGEELLPLSNQKVEVGDRIRVRTVIRVDRPMEYVHLKDMRPAGLEPVQNVSGYKYSHGLGYYVAPKDIATHFFIDFLRPGTFTFEYDLVASLKGDYSTGISTIQCMYAPEFSSHSKGERIQIR